MLWLITGGYAQGKTSYVKRMPAAQRALWVDLRTAADAAGAPCDAPGAAAAGPAVADAAGTDRPAPSAAAAVSCGLAALAPDQTLVVDGFECMAAVCPADEPAVESALAAVVARARCRTVILIGTDTGSGIVPLGTAQRQLREAAGRLQTRAAGLADWVIRLFCGLPDILKQPAGYRRAGGLTLYLIRHGATASNLQRRYMGRTDEALCESGRAAIADWQARGHFPRPDCLICSPMRRCLETAALAFPGRLPDRIEPRLIERDFGAFELKNYEELHTRPDYQVWLAGWGRDCPPGGESQADIGRRVEAALRDILSENGIANRGTGGNSGDGERGDGSNSGGAGGRRCEQSGEPLHEPSGEQRVEQPAEPPAGERPAEPSAGRSVALVVHGGVIMELMRVLGFEAYYDWQLTNGSWVRLDFDRSGRLSDLPPVVGGQLVGAVV